MPKLPPQPDHCELCGRSVPKLTRHHLIPKRLHRLKRFQKLYSREEMIARTLWVCRPCHNAIHRAASTKKLGYYYNTRERLLELEDLRAFVEWIADKPPEFVPKGQRRQA